MSRDMTFNNFIKIHQIVKFAFALAYALGNQTKLMHLWLLRKTLTQQLLNTSRALRPTPCLDQVDAMEEVSTRCALPGKHASGVIAVSIHARRLDAPRF